MNGKKAKLLRVLAGREKKSVLVPVDSTRRNRQVTEPGTGKVISSYTTVTLKLSPGTRQLNKVLKRMYKMRMRAGL